MTTEQKVALVERTWETYGLNRALAAVDLPKSTWYYHRTQKVSIQYIPVQAEELLDQMRYTYKELVISLKGELTVLDSAPDLEYVWSIQGHKNISPRHRR